MSTEHTNPYETRVQQLEAEGCTRSDAQSIAEAEAKNGGWAVIHTYTRKQAIEDGVLIDVSAAAFGLGYQVHVAMTATAHAVVDRAGQHTKTASERLFAFLRAQKVEIQDQIWRFGSSVGSEFEWVYRNRVRLKAHIGPGDHGEPVLTILLPGED
jgi:hypothetical protein